MGITVDVKKDSLCAMKRGSRTKLFEAVVAELTHQRSLTA